MTLADDKPGVVARPPLLYLGGLVAALVGRWLTPLPVTRQAVAIPLGLVFIAVGLGIAIWGRRTMLAAGTNVDPTLPATTIVTSGPFRFSRNPLYIGLTLLYLGLTLAFNTWWGAVLVVPLLIIMSVGVVGREERYLEKKFGDEYRAYKARVRRWL
jgi:protein-S-isoprenylcysteine O-methyltransferase Ste14